MAGKLTVNEIILGDSSTPSQNFLFKTNQDGTATLARNADGSGGNILTVNADGGVKCNQPAFRAFQASDQSLASGSANATATNYTKAFDTANCFNATTGLFTPNVAGYYQFNVCSAFNAVAVTGGALSIRLNGISEIASSKFTNSTQAAVPYLSTSSLIYLNGSSDYVSILAGNTGGSSAWVFKVLSFDGCLVRAS